MKNLQGKGNFILTVTMALVLHPCTVRQDEAERYISSYNDFVYIYIVTHYLHTAIPDVLNQYCVPTVYYQRSHHQ